MSPKPRLTNKHLPPRVYLKNGAYRFLSPEGKWIRLGKTLAEAMEKWTELFTVSLRDNTMHAIFDRYLTEILPLKSPKTYKSQIYSLKNLRSYFGDMIPETVTPVDVYGYIDIRGQTSVCAANKELSILSDNFTYAIRWGRVKTNPCVNVKRFKEPKRDYDVPASDVNSFSEWVPSWVKAIVLFDYLSALRLSDLLIIKRTDATEEGIRVFISKTQKWALVKWTDELVKAWQLAISSQQFKSIYLFPTRKGKPYTDCGFKAIWQRLMVKAAKDGIISKRFMFKDLRAKTATDVHNKKGIIAAQELLDHTTSRTTKRHYVRGITQIKPAR